jgi:hypothetical protein
MSKISAKVIPVKVTPLSTAGLNSGSNKSAKASVAWTEGGNQKAQNMPLDDNYNTSSNRTTKRNITWQDNDGDFVQRQNSSIHRKYASVLKMTKTEYEAFKEKYANENGKLDAKTLETAAKNVNKIKGNEVFSITSDEAVLKLAQRVKSRQDDRSGYCHCLYFILIQ